MSKRKPPKNLRPHDTALVLERLTAKAKRAETGCLEWIGDRNHYGYGRISFLGSGYRAHRLMYLASKGDIPPNLIVRHTCDNPACI